MNNIDLLLTNGKIYSMDINDTVYSWLTINDGVVSNVGTGAPPDLSYAETVDLNGKSVFPGMYDNHVNLMLAGINSFAVNLSNAQSLEEVFSIISDKSRTINSGDTIRCVAFRESSMREGRLPTRHELDQCAPNNPVIIHSISHHSSSVNSIMLHKLALPFNIDGVDKDPGNTLTGYLSYQANVYARNMLFSQMDDKKRTEAVNQVIKHAIENGITNLVTFEGGFISHEEHAKYIIDNKAIFPIDINMYYQSIDLSKALEYKQKKAGGVFLDGTITSRTAAISENYVDSKGNGILYFTQDDINEYVLQAHREGLQLTAHCVGDRAAKQLITAYEHAQSKHPRDNIRHRIEHCEIFDNHMIERAKKLNLVLSMQPAYEYYWGGHNGLYRSFIGELANRTNPIRELIDAGLIVAGGSDYDITDISPWLGIHTAVNHPNPYSRIAIRDAIKMYTIHGAYAVFEEDEKGSLEIGKKGDCIVIDADPYEIDNKKIKDISPIMTIKEGHILYKKNTTITV